MQLTGLEVSFTKRLSKLFVWVRDRDYATNMPGPRTFQVGVDGHRVNKTFGTHGQEGFRWTEAGTFELDEEVVELSLVDRTMSLQTGKQIGQRMKFLFVKNAFV